MLGWVIAAIVAVLFLAVQSRFTRRAIENTSIALRAASDWKRRAEAAESELDMLVEGHKCWPDVHWRRASDFLHVTIDLERR